MKQLSKFVAVLLLTLPLASAQQTRVYGEGGNWTQEIAGSLAMAKNLHIKVDIGSVRVEGGSQQGISYVIRNHSYSGSEDSARHQFDNYKISAYVHGDTAWIVAIGKVADRINFPGTLWSMFRASMDEIKIETEGGSVTTTGVTGRVDAESGGGSIHLDDIGGAINAETGGGSIDVGNVASDVSLHTGGGSIKMNSAKGKIDAESGGGSVVIVSGLQGAVLETGGGSIQVDQCAGQVKASDRRRQHRSWRNWWPAEMETGGGSIRLTSANGPVSAETGGGSIELNGVPSARAETGVGGIVAKFVSTSGEHHDSVLETSAGDITVYLAADLKINVRAVIEVANGHSIRSDFPDIRVSSEGGD